MKVSRYGRGLSFIEVLIAVLVVSACAIPIIYMVTSTRTDTSKAINYLRAVELANEALEWASVAKFSQIDSFVSGLNGPISVDIGGNLQPISIQTAAPANQVWADDGLVSTNLSYSEQYNNAFFFREIEVEDVSDAMFADNLIKKVTVTVKWCEGYRPANPNLPDERSRKVELAVLILNDENLSY